MLVAWHCHAGCSCLLMPANKIPSPMHPLLRSFPALHAAPITSYVLLWTQHW